MPYKDKESKIKYQREYMRKRRGTNKVLDPVRPDVLDPVAPLMDGGKNARLARSNKIKYGGK